MKKTGFLLLLMFLLLANYACEMNENNNKVAEPDELLITSDNIQNIAGIEWALKSIEVKGQEPLIPTESNPTFTLLADKKVAGNAGINRYFGNYKINSEGVIMWQEPGFGSTMMAGPAELMEQEQQFLQNLQKTNRILKQSNGLKLTNSDATVQLFFHAIGGSKE